MTPMRYKGYHAVAAYDPEIEMFRGEVIDINGNVDFYADNVAALKKEFRISVDTYLDVCNERGIEPEKPYSGKLNVRLGKELHQSAAVAAAANNMTLNAYIKAVVESGVSGRIPVDPVVNNRPTK